MRPEVGHLSGQTTSARHHPSSFLARGGEFQVRSGRVSSTGLVGRRICCYLLSAAKRASSTGVGASQ
eukprot:1560037-Lingulodinium_polyedra.AAC.1